MGRLFHKAYDETWGKINWSEQKDCLATVKSLFAQGAKVNATDADNVSVLQDVIRSRRPGWQEAALFLIENGAKVNNVDRNGYSPLIDACYNKDSLKVVEALVNKGAKVNHKSNDRTRANRTPNPSKFALKGAVATGDKEVVDFLIGAGANVNLRDSSGNQAISYLPFARKNGAKDVVGMIDSLVKAGADVNAHNWMGDTPLMDAAADGDLASFEKLFKEHADINAVAPRCQWDTNGNFEYTDIPQRTSLSIAIWKNQPKIIKFCLDHEAKVDESTQAALNNVIKNKETRNDVLSFMTAQGKPEQVDLLQLKMDLLHEKLGDKVGKTADVATGQVTDKQSETVKTQVEMSKVLMEVKREKEGKSS